MQPTRQYRKPAPRATRVPQCSLPYGAGLLRTTPRTGALLYTAPGCRPYAARTWPLVQAPAPAANLPWYYGPALCALAGQGALALSYTITRLITAW
jgi:hypothetical protein